MLFYVSFLDVILPSKWIPQPKYFPFIWWSWILLEMHRNTKTFRINFKKHATVKL